MSKINSRSKGGRYERELVKKFEGFWGTHFSRTPYSGAWTGNKTQEGHDTVTGDIITAHESNFPFTVEAKMREGWTIEHLINNTGQIKEWWGQTVRDGENGNKVPLLVYRRNYLPHDYVTLPFHSGLFQELLTKEAVVMASKIIYEDEATGDDRAFLTMTTHFSDFEAVGKDFYIEEFTDFDWKKTEVDIGNFDDRTIKETTTDILDMMFD